jgi:hypothetical protein
MRNFNHRNGFNFIIQSARMTLIHEKIRLERHRFGEISNPDLMINFKTLILIRPLSKLTSWAQLKRFMKPLQVVFVCFLYLSKIILSRFSSENCPNPVVYTISKQPLHRCGSFRENNVRQQTLLQIPIKLFSSVFCIYPKLS